MDVWVTLRDGAASAEVIGAYATETEAEAAAFRQSQKAEHYGSLEVVKFDMPSSVERERDEIRQAVVEMQPARERRNRCGSCSQHERIERLEIQLESDRADYAAMQRALDDRHKRIRELEYEAQQQRTLKALLDEGNDFTHGRYRYTCESA